MNIVLANWFLLALVAVLAIGYGFSSQLVWLADLKWLRYGIVACVLFVMAWPLETTAIGRILRRPWAPLLASAINLGLVPLLAWPLARLLGGELGPGLIVAASVPCTLATAAVWTRRAGGDDAAVMLVVVITNTLCFVVTPLWLLGLTSNRVDVSAYTQLIGQLFLLVLVPMVIAQLSRSIGRLAVWATRQKVALGLVAQIGVLSMVCIGAVQMGMRIGAGTSHLTVGKLALTLSAVGLLHFSVLAIGLVLARRAGFARSQQIAIAFSGSQKTMMVGLTTGLELGFNIIPMVVYHLVQLIGDTTVADWFRKSSRLQAGPESEG